MKCPCYREGSVVIPPQKIWLSSIKYVELLSQLSHWPSIWWSKYNFNRLKTKQCTEVRFVSFFSGGFITAIGVNIPERKLAKHTSVQWVTGLDLGYSKLFIFIFVKLWKNKENKMKGFLQRILQEIMKKKNPIRRSTQRPSNLTYHIADCWISGLKVVTGELLCPPST